jgi:hypothetical protein
MGLGPTKAWRIYAFLVTSGPGRLWGLLPADLIACDLVGNDSVRVPTSPVHACAGQGSKRTGIESRCDCINTYATGDCEAPGTV